MTASLLLAMPAAWLDAWLLDQFPGKTLEELDGIDFTRLMRANKVKAIGQVETLRRLQQLDRAKPSPADWRAIVRHDRLMERYYEDG